MLAGLMGVAVILAAGCGNLGYYGQAARGQFQIISKQEKISHVLDSPETPADLKKRLLLIGELREFAERELKLNPGRHYLRYADVDRKYVVWNVQATPEFSLKAKSWWYPIVGRQTYRGYFSESAANHYAEKLRAEGYEAYVGGVEAYSTLGWFSDPVLNTWVHRDEAGLAGLVFHELAHHKVYVSGDTPFNEAFATAVEQAGVRLWLKQRNDSEALAKWEAAQKRRLQFVALVKAVRSNLARLYADTNAGGEADRRARKTTVLDEFRDDLRALRKEWGARYYESWLTEPISNPRLNTVSTYHDLVPGFVALLAEKSGNYSEFFKEVEKLGRKSKTKRRERLNHALSGKRAN